MTSRGRCTYPAITPRWPLMYGPTIRGVTTFRIGVPGSIRAACAGSRAEPTDGLLPPCAVVQVRTTRCPGRGLHIAAGQETPTSGTCAQLILPWSLTILIVKYVFHGFRYFGYPPPALACGPSPVAPGPSPPRPPSPLHRFVASSLSPLPLTLP